MGTLRITKTHQVDRDNSSPLALSKFSPTDGIPVQSLTTSGSSDRVEVTGNPKRLTLRPTTDVCVQIGDATVTATSGNHFIPAYESYSFAPDADGNFYVAAIEV